MKIHEQALNIEYLQNISRLKIFTITFLFPLIKVIKAVAD